MFGTVLSDVIPGDHGGVFAGRHFNTLDTVLKWDGLSLADQVRHSCDPTCGLVIQEEVRTIIAIRPLNALQEITIDVSTWRKGQEDFSCSCKRPLCRKTITDFSKLPKYLKDRYLRMNIVDPELARRWKPAE